MSPSTLHQLLIICIFPFIVGTAFAFSQCREDQQSLLLGFKEELTFNSSFSRKLAHWNRARDCCRWGGVECDGTGRVISLQLDDESISGAIENSSALFSLSYLKKLNLAYNSFSLGIQIPAGIHSLTYLTHLNLSNTGFGGQVPIELSYLRRLVSLDISARNRGFPPLKAEHPSLKNLLQNLTGLRELYLDNLVISAQESHWTQTISSYLPDLRVLSLRGCDLSGPLHPSLSQIHSLSVLQLDGNNLSSAVPGFFANFTSLTSLSMSECYLQGTFPQTIFLIPTLQNLDLSFNVLLSGTLPHFPHRGSLRSVVLRYTNFSASLPYSISNLGMLSHMDLSNCKFIGSISSVNFTRLSNLVYVDLQYNSLSGSIPESLFGLPYLQTLRLSNNQFNGTAHMKKIPKLHNLTELDLSYNKLSIESIASFSKFPQLNVLGLASCNLQSFPDLRNQHKLSALDLSSNRIHGEIPSWIWEIGNGSLSQLNLSSNLLVDLQKPYNIPTSMELLDLHANQLRGEFPQPSKGNSFYYLSFFSVANNSLTGSIPTSLCSFTFLQVLDLSVNKLSGSIPPCLFESIENLLVFNLGRNNISGEIPDRFSPDCRLMTLDLNNNNLERKIPSSLGNCKLLEVLNVGSNKINDSFPCMLPSSLLILVLRSNRFHGEIRCHDSWPDLQVIDIAYNDFRGDLQPINFSSWTGMKLDGEALLRRNRSSFSLLKPTSYDYRNEVTLTIKGLELKLVRIWPEFASIDFSCNNFQGEIPNAIGDLTSAYLLNLSHNSLTGEIPNSLGKLRQLGSLDLSVNQLQGEIPEELSHLTFLSVLNLSHNKLVGKIPVGSQIQTFSPDSFEGNTRLCGLPLNISCSDADGSTPKLGKVESRGEREIEWDYVFGALGYVVGLGSIVWVLLCCRGFRVKYFEKVEDVFDRVFYRHQRKKIRSRGRRVAGLPR